LNLVKGIGPVRFRRLIDHFGDPQTAWQASLADLAAAGLDRRSIENLEQVRRGAQLDAALRAIDQTGAQVLTWDDEGYPRNLRDIPQPPPVLFVRGTLTPGDEWAVAMVGTRRASAYGKEAARELAAGLAANGVTVVSGLARGIDEVAHQAALEAGGRTIAVLGSGVDVIYPAENRGLAKAIVQAGAVVSDYPMGTAPEGTNFPPRNRIISGLSKGVIVVEAGEVSGALITTDFAAEQGRDVFAVPGSIRAPTARGTNRLIQQGAKLVTSVGDVLEELNMVMVSEQRTARAVLPADETEAKLLACLSAEPAHIDDVGAQAGLPISQVSGALALMELKGLVRQVGGMNYVVAREPRAGYSAE
jgi:DNA processing protein